MQETQLTGLTAMQLMVQSLENVKQKDNTTPLGDKINQTLEACKQLAIGLLEVEKSQLEDAYRNSDFETYYNNRFYNQNNK
jgi:hypothetical protein